MKYKIPLSQPCLTQDDFQELKKCFDSTWISSKSPWVEKFERLFAQRVSKTKYAVAVNSGTSALFLTLKALRIVAGHEVILPTFTMIAAINAVVWAGAKPVLVDCCSYSDWNLSVDEIEKKITSKTKAIIAVHTYGYPCQIDRIKMIAKKHNLYLIEDAAEAMGSVYKGKTAGSFGDLSCFSLYANKIITTGNGGMVASNNKKLYKLIRQISFFDYNPKLHFTHRIFGYNLVLSGLQASLGVSQIRRLDRLLFKRKKTFSWYVKYLGENKNAYFLKPTKSQSPSFWFPALIFSNYATKERVRQVLEKEGVETRPFFRPIHLQPLYKNTFNKESFPKAEYFYQRGLLLPSFFDLKEKTVRSIINIVINNLD